jgi:MFS family permease
MNKIVKSFIVSEFFWASAWNAIIPVFSVFAIKAVPGSNISLATTAFGVHVAVRIIVELLFSKYFSNVTSNRARIMFTLIGIVIVCCGYIGFAFIDNPALSYVFYGLLGLGIGISVPPKMALFSSNLEKGKEAFAWSILDVTSMGGSAVAAVIAGTVIHIYGFQTLFAISAFVNLLSALPYILLIDDRDIMK